MRMKKITLYFKLPVGTRTFIVDTYPNGAMEAIVNRLCELREKRVIQNYKIEDYNPAMLLETFLNHLNTL